MQQIPFIKNLSEAIFRPGTVRRLTFNTIWLFIDRVIGIVNGLLIGTWVARYLGPEQFGLYSYVIAYVALFIPVAELGLNVIVVRNLAKDPFEKDKIIGSAFLLQLLGGIFAFILAIIVAALNGFQSDNTFWMVVVASIRLTFTCASVVDYWFQSRIQSKYVVWVNSSVSIVIGVTKVVCILLRASVFTFILVSLLQFLLVALGLVIIYSGPERHFRTWKVSSTHIKELLNDGWPLLISGLATAVYMRFDKVLLGAMVGSDIVGIYSSAGFFVEFWFFIPTMIATSVFPLIIETAEMENVIIYRERMQHFYDLMAAISYVLTIPLVIFARPLVLLVFGTEYASAGDILAVYALSLIFVFLGVARGRWLVAENMHRVYMMTTVFGAIVNVTLNYIFIPKYGGVGAAWVTVVSYAVASYISCAIWPSLWPTFGQLTLALFLPFRIKSMKRVFNAFI